jgi:hypothetical protein
MENIIQGFYRFLEIALEIKLTDNAKNIIRQQAMSAWMSNNVYFMQAVNFQVNGLLPQLLNADPISLNAWRSTNQPQFVAGFRNSYDPMSRVLIELYDNKQKPIEQPRYQRLNQNFSETPFEQPIASNFSQPSVVGLWTGEQNVLPGWKESYRFNEDMTFQKISTGTTVRNSPFMSILKGNYELSGSQIIMQTTDETYTPENAPPGSSMLNRSHVEERIFTFTLQNSNQVLVLKGLNTNALPHSITLYRQQEK